MSVTGAEVIARVREHQSHTLLAFSGGKDAVAAWVVLSIVALCIYWGVERWLDER